ncbi:DUF2986 domain-containing protein [Shewanella sp. D64]|uniref:DUF2986 domain-containing protein n=1 Tax=unclassified Shewanella TaxID=196818 RepID=UPI0022BA2BD6|nr:MULTISPECIES: DUF2986 domain-containing protein [unclassified Shewanella]MEC4728306.1 DUF2986 domain-containing protein [Shewanella sp. D64]MEC4740379.1 DUF2986 domain-containing protein [Shewanella sp. E94]WBJ93323.1 DUF2986 domain-containing protein [Shewanella sp. MTB7]
MNRKQKMIKMTAKRAKARLNKHTAPTIKKYVSKGDRAKALAQEQAEAALSSNKPNDEVRSDAEETQDINIESSDTTQA